ncbi:MAG: translation initiation factor IF-2 [Oscillatoriales cyanobacterium]|nr:MAG: translation initiation factor IF-2 [Oscillatoriales cyanobacterium]
MNNGKVRLYELSKELNVDNKQILAHCDQLEIAYKSHSSTISESDAHRIRKAAKTSAIATPPTRPTPPHSSATPERPSMSPERPKIRKQQQILQVKKTPSADAPKRPELSKPVPPKSAEASAAKPSAAAPTPPAVTPPAKPSPPAKPPTVRPVSAKTKEPTKPVAASPAAPPAAPPSTPPVKTPDPIKPAPKPQLVGPPQRAAKAAAPKTQLSAGVAPPKLKKKGDPGSEPTIPEKTSAPAPTASNPPRREPVPDLKRPQLVRLNSASTKSKIADDDDDVDSITATPKDDDGETTTDLTLNRPKPPRKPKAKKRKGEVEEVEDKVVKVNKPKRRVRPISDDDDFEDDDLANGEVVVEVSKSIARPPKQVKPKAEVSRTPASPKRKGSSRSGSRNNRRDRRDRVAKIERPEAIELIHDLTVRELANELCVSETEIVKSLFLQGIAVNVTQTLDIPTATQVAEELGVVVLVSEAESEATKSTEMIDATDLEKLQRRPPVVTIMGHVDHGKTTLLDAIRKTKVAQGEAGGITQHTGAYHVDVEHNGVTQQVVFLDTPGHEAFTAMRARGARVTDIAVLVVAADDGVQPQTVEAIGHARAAGVPLVVAINKIDKEEAQPDRIKQELMEYQLVAEEWGGDTIMVPLSAKTGENLDTLLEMLVLVADVEELSANPDRPAKGTVIEAHLDKARGPVATLLIQNGTLRVGECLVAGSVFGKVRAMVDDRRNRITDAYPSYAVEVLGMSDVPAAGDEFDVFLSEKEARSVADARSVNQRQSRLQQAMASRRVTLSSLSAQASEGDLKELNLILKADVQGSLEAILGALEQLPQDEVQVRVLLSAPGEITETDIDLAAASNAVIVGFSTTLATGARQAADREGVDIREYNVIYKLLDDIQGAMEGLLEPELVEEDLGQAEVRAVFPSGRGSVAGCYVLNGQLVRNCNIRVLRKDKVVFSGILDSLRRMREDVKEVNTGFECGVGLPNFNGWEEGDIISAFRMVTKRRTLASR